MTENRDARPRGEIKQAYIGKDDCEVASCPHKQEFPNGDSDRCLIHALEEFSYAE